MITRQSFTADPTSVIRIIKWWVAKSASRYHRVRRDGTIEDFINDVWVRLLLTFPPNKELDCMLSTAVVHCCHWELAAYRRIGEKHTWKLRRRLQNARRIKPTDRTTIGDEVFEHAYNNELSRALTRALWTLTLREAALLRAVWGLFGDVPMTIKEVTEITKMSRRRILERTHSGFRRLQHPMRSNKLLRFVNEVNPPKGLE